LGLVFFLNSYESVSFLCLSPGNMVISCFVKFAQTRLDDSHFQALEELWECSPGPALSR